MFYRYGGGQQTQHTSHANDDIDDTFDWDSIMWPFLLVFYLQ